jgi:ketosteroid isomerase-like protein
MKSLVFPLISVIIITACQKPADKEEIKKEIFQTEKAFEKMASEVGIAEAFYFFADENAVIKRENDTLIIGKENIKLYYEKGPKNATVNWTPDFVDVADCGTLGYTYGQFAWKIKNDAGELTEYKGVFHTVWKKQEDKSWRYVWD